MILYPAIDLMGGRCVRLRQGRFEEPIRYPLAPVGALAWFEDSGANWVHVVDLDGAKGEGPAQHKLIATLVRKTKLSLQVAGGFRTRDQVARMLDAGAARIVIGSLAVHYPSTVQALFAEFGPDRIALAFDVRTETGEPIVATKGWLNNSGKRIDEVAAFYPALRHAIVTDISRDGMLAGPNINLMRELRGRLPNLDLQASGGVTTYQDIEALSGHAAGAIVGRALWEQSFDLKEGMRLARS